MMLAQLTLQTSFAAKVAHAVALFKWLLPADGQLRSRCKEKTGARHEAQKQLTAAEKAEALPPYIVTMDEVITLSEEVAGETIFKRNSDSDRIYEFGCHEGNYSMAGILAGARRAQLNN